MGIRTGIARGLDTQMTSISEDSQLNALLARLADGERAAFTPVFEQLREPILRLCLSLLKNEADASDATQQAMAKIFERASDYDPSRPALPWALAIAAWECRTIRLRSIRRREVSDNALEDGAHDRGEDALLQRDLVTAALKAMGELSSTDRETLIATFTDEGSDVLGATFRKRRERAVARLRTAFRRLYGFD